MRIFLFTLIITLPLYSLAQFNNPIKVLSSTEYVVTYSLKYQRDSLNPDFIAQKNMLLFIGQNISKFISEDFFISDTIMRNVKSWSEYDAIVSVPNSRVPRTAFRYQIFKNYPKGELSCIDYTVDGGFIYKENLDLFNWQLTGDTATLYGYKVQKATAEFGGRSWMAWFTPDLSFNDGPYKFSGLPGLIVKIADSRNHYVFEFISIKKPYKELMIDYVEKDYIKTTKEDFFKAEDDFRNDILFRAKDAGLSSELQHRAARNMAERNNLLELKRK